MSCKGTLPIVPRKSTFETCIAAVESCDLFLGLITPNYGSGSSGAGARAITHDELLKAVELGKPRWIVAHENVILARRLLMDLGYETAAHRTALALRKGSVVIDDLRLIDMYEDATLDGVPIADRRDNWVQPYRTPQDLFLYLQEQFGRYDDMERFVHEWRNRKAVGP
jgi:hypothetical protein